MLEKRSRLAQVLKSGSQSICKIGRQKNVNDIKKLESFVAATQSPLSIQQLTGILQGEYDVTTGFICWSDASSNLPGQTDIFKRTSFQDFLSHYSATETEAALAAMESALTDHAGTEVILSFEKESGACIRHRVTFIPQEDGSGGTQKVLCLVQDISAIKTFEPGTSGRHVISNPVEDNIQDVLFRVSLPEGAFTHISRGVQQVTGYPAESWYRNPYLLLDLIPPAWQAKFKREFEKYLLGWGEEEKTFPIQHPEGEIRWIQLRATLVKDNQGKLLAIEGIASDITAKKLEEMERKQLIRELRKALEDVKTLSGLLPICSFCKKVRDDQGYWKQIESYITEHSELFFTHGLCPDCLTHHYPEYFSSHTAKQNQIS